MNSIFQQTLIRRKIRFAIRYTSTIGVLMVSLVFALYMSISEWRSMHDNIRTHARRTGLSCLFSLSFDDPRDAKEVLENLNVLSGFEAATIYRKDGTFFTHYTRSGVRGLPRSIAIEGLSAHRLSLSQMVLTEPILSGKELIGYVSIAYSLSQFYLTLCYSLVTLIFGLILAQLLAYWISCRFQTVLSVPIEELSATARRVADTADYTVRAEESSYDEVGRLARDFNKMLVEVQARDDELLSDKRRFRALVDQAVDAILLIREDGRLVDCNPLAVSSLNATRDELLARRVGDVIPAFDRDSFAALWEEVLTGAHPIVSTSIPCGDQASFPAEIKVGLLQHRDENLLVAFCRDITLRIAAQKRLKLTEECLQQSQKMESVGRLAGGIAHDFNNMLMGILGAAEILQLQAEDESSKRYLEVILSSVKQASQLTEKLLIFSRKKKIGTVPFEIHQCIRDALEILRHSVDPRIQINENYGAQDTEVAGERVLIQNVVLNLGVNARDAIQNNGEISISTSNVELSADECKATPFKLKPGEYVRIDIQDTGSGMSPDVKKKIFEPFYTTKDIGKGTGMGLSSAYGTVIDHQGAISVESQEGEGSTFSILLPVSTESVAKPVGLEGPSASAERARILLVDDEPTVRMLLAEHLKRLGHTVVLATDGEDGLQKYRENPEGIDLVILDMLMPRMNGIESFAAMKKLNPSVRAIMISGYTKGTSESALKTAGIHAVIRKPFTIDILRKILGTVLTPVLPDDRRGVAPRTGQRIDASRPARGKK